MDLCAKDRITGHGEETAMDVDEAMNRETSEVKFMGLGATVDLEEPNSDTKGKIQGSTSSGTHSHPGKIREKGGIAASLDKMTNSFDRMIEKMDGKVDDEDTQEVLLDIALIPDRNRDNNGLKMLNGYCEQGIERNCILTKQEKKLIIISEVASMLMIYDFRS
ncbi:hypothetical protein GmHk_10G029557 [Glycine max]|nr:hypothetical protein GmHk_10G029557 [Glycine max]